MRAISLIRAVSCGSFLLNSLTARSKQKSIPWPNWVSLCCFTCVFGCHVEHLCSFWNFPPLQPFKEIAEGGKRALWAHVETTHQVPASHMKFLSCRLFLFFSLCVTDSWNHRLVTLKWCLWSCIWWSVITASISRFRFKAFYEFPFVPQSCYLLHLPPSFWIWGFV